MRHEASGQQQQLQDMRRAASPEPREAVSGRGTTASRPRQAAVTRHTSTPQLAAAPAEHRPRLHSDGVHSSRAHQQQVAKLAGQHGRHAAGSSTSVAEPGLEDGADSAQPTPSSHGSTVDGSMDSNQARLAAEAALRGLAAARPSPSGSSPASSSPSQHSRFGPWPHHSLSASWQGSSAQRSSPMDDAGRQDTGSSSHGDPELDGLVSEVLARELEDLLSRMQEPLATSQSGTADSEAAGSATPPPVSPTAGSPSMAEASGHNAASTGTSASIGRHIDQALLQVRL